MNIALLIRVVLSSLILVATIGAGPAIVTNGRNFACDTLEALRWFNYRYVSNQFTEFREIFAHGCYPMTRGWPATILSSGADYVKIHVTPSDGGKPFTAFTIPEEVAPE